MIIGDRRRFAIEAVVDELTDSGWTFGRLRFWIDGLAVGNWNDAVDAKGCLRWLRDFVDDPRDRVEPGLMNRPSSEVFELLWDSVMHGGNTNSQPAVVVRDPYPRFHISHLGMSAFDRFDLLLLKDEIGRERCLWREAEGPIHDVILMPGEMERVADEFCAAFGAEVNH